VSTINIPIVGKVQHLPRLLCAASNCVLTRPERQQEDSGYQQMYSDPLSFDRSYYSQGQMWM